MTDKSPAPSSSKLETPVLRCSKCNGTLIYKRTDEGFIVYEDSCGRKAEAALKPAEAPDPKNAQSMSTEDLIEWLAQIAHDGKEDWGWIRSELMRRTSSPELPRQTFWVVERFENAKSAGYWDGGSSRSFQPNIDEAIQFRRKQDAYWATRGWHWEDVQLTEHLYMDKMPALTPSSGEDKF